MISRKVILTGSFGVGKTSLFNQFIYQKFDDKYLTTIGVKVNNKIVEANNQKVSMMVWDIAGEVSQDKVPVSYFLGASGIIYVMDLSRPLTFANIEADIQFLRDVAPNGDILIIANKVDLVTPDQVAAIAKDLPHAWDYATSAKTGENVEALFFDMANRLLDQV
jgi:small GTP-binding protein